ncbi:MAG: DNA mismatch repair endonuclease MutL [Candidatus Eisenbacteria bacterium]|nr:DNA mismatch repair endonuclease MutL [Candidatus Eisenbacteria bacterium]
MTGAIRRLPEAVISRIAAGEMIARPSSAVKELIENSLDAQASAVEIRVRERIDRAVEVSDDGAGIPRDELSLALERHATSKLSSEEELDAIATLGFRGEALPSIARISRLTLTTRTAGSAEAWSVTASGGAVGEPHPASRAPGTTVLVEDLFFNAPVRKRSLGSPAYEIRLARQYVQHYALISLPVRWTLHVDDRKLVDLPPAKRLEDRLTDIFGGDLLPAAAPVSYTATIGSGRRAGSLRVEGFLGAPERAKPSPAHQLQFVNGRAIVSSRLIQALRQGYGDLIPPGRHPWAVLFITLDPQLVDVNVHPTKREVRFYPDDQIFREVMRAVRQTTAAFRPGLYGSVASPDSTDSQRAGRRGTGTTDPHDAGRVLPFAPPRDRIRDGKGLARSLYGRPDTQEFGEGAAGATGQQETPRGEIGPAPSEGPTRRNGAFWQLDRRYIVVPRERAVLVVDQHAAHERILYERAMARWGEEGAPSQKLLFPEVLELDEERVEAFRSVSEDLHKLGFEAEIFGGTSILVRAVPQLAREPAAAALLGRILEDIAAPELRRGESLEALAKSFACRCAVKSGQMLQPEEMRCLVSDLFDAELPHGDPHGRPTYIELRVEDLDRRFQRS